jgi:protein-disulfide isomerase/uncharacterized membrane protein
MSSERKGGNASLRFAIGIVLLAIALAASLILALDRLRLMDAPGCGAGAACDRASASAFGSLPILGWPLSYVGCAWFAGLLVAWVRARGEVGTLWIRLTQIGAAASLFYLGILAGLGLPCPYCIAAHAANLAFLVLLETQVRVEAISSRKPLILTASSVCAVAVVLALLDAKFASDVRARAERELSGTSAALRAQGDSDRGGFTGRHRRGPEKARARFVVFTDYQCKDCHEFEGQLDAALANSSDTSVSIRYFPFCKACNPYAPDLHSNACWAARAAEAAAIVAGDDGFWRMHRWLFARGGAFTDVELDKGLAELGIDRAKFLSVMQSDVTLARVKEDIELAMKLGLTWTPMVFVNGVEMRGLKAPDALSKTLAAARVAPAASDASADRPLSARERFIDQWRTSPQVTLAPDTTPHVLGPVDARVKVVLFGDLVESFTCAADAELRDLALRRNDVSYAFRTFPVNRACNPAVEVDAQKLGCLAALGAEAMAALQGEDGYWSMHDWIVTHREKFDDAQLTEAARQQGIERDAFWNAMTNPELQTRIVEDALAAKAQTVTSIPLIFVNGRRVENWRAGEESLLTAIVTEAAGH